MASPTPSRRTIAAAIEHLAERYRRRFPPALRGPRRIGREAEFPLVRSDGRAGDVALLWEPLLREPGARPTFDDSDRRGLIVRVDLPDAAYEVEMGRATAEMVLPPARNLEELEAMSATASSRLVRIAGSAGMHALGYGIQPRTPAGPSLMTPKRRYYALSSAFGRPYFYFTATASDQVQIDIARDELVDAVNFMNLLSGPIIALTANSSVYAGRIGRFASGREGLMASLGEHRHGMTPRRFVSLEDYLEFICRQTCYVLPQRSRLVRYGRPFTAYLRARVSNDVWTSYLWHEHYTWNSARPRVGNATIEMRPACQQPPDEPLAAAALSLGLVEALPWITSFMTDLLGPDPWPAMAAYRRAVVRQGIRAREPVPELLAGVVDLAERALRLRRRGEEEYLQPVRRRLETRALPADRAVKLFRQGGVSALIRGLTL